MFGLHCAGKRVGRKVGQACLLSYKKKTFREVWLSDRGAFPVIAILAVATVFPIIYGTVVMIKSPDARFFRPGRKQIFRGEVDQEISEEVREREHQH